MTAGHDTAVLVVEDADAMPPAEVAGWLRERLDGWSEQDVRLVEVVAGELFANARRHGAPPYVLELLLNRRGESLVVSARDRTVGRLRPWRPAAGLLLVGALSARWGITSRAGTTTVWAELLFED
ncbi:ATP-binding protein [Saccharothrix longispora]|uniref:ATP-binding protein n=1 Tax=Saccharothrix longispora TaxID=33920 RepID=UPI0028FD91FA|nr:ATP-binding protein [Saccharothrix longispora]MBY8850698.1 ATP-binding protein [Saccharothrix sp. MB29]MDU0293948.1 ATP-binding protein [Saccharothrix longispora]